MRGTRLIAIGVAGCALAACGSSNGSGPDAPGTGGPDAAPISDIIDPARITTWNPGILADDQLGLPLGPDDLPQRTTTCATLSPGDDIQAAVDTCPEGQVVELVAGTFTIATTITLTRGVVLRGAGSQGAPGGTTIVKTGGETVLAIGTDRDSTRARCSSSAAPATCRRRRCSATATTTWSTPT